MNPLWTPMSPGGSFVIAAAISLKVVEQAYLIAEKKKSTISGPLALELLILQL